jgi:UDP-N-acetylglucosamine diphosphorylase / glucose-1-phosphate thymidylyltransferase / UDP-N-acetylgalactosamine diphosphorylase / glucosamine-1-phosphate N-acetyltransferase / galactosamine-1-phosphate N-acetyltransferase
MNVLILMAGEGQRFKAVGNDTPKPFIEVNGKSLLEWTTRSLPFIRHYNEEMEECLSPESLFFAIREDQSEYGIEEKLKIMYGEDINLIIFKKTTRGNLETAYTCISMMDPDVPVLVLDSDNKYNDNSYLDTLTESSEFKDSMVVSYFDPIDDSDKWAFVISDGALVTEIVEKDKTALQRGGRPLIGTFWFSTADLFMKYADFILRNNLKTGTPGREEFYISQVPSMHTVNGGAVFAHKVDDVIPLGTPEDVKKYEYPHSWADLPLG